LLGKGRTALRRNAENSSERRAGDRGRDQGTTLRPESAVVGDRYEDETEWLRCRREGTKLRSACGPMRLEDALVISLDRAGG